MIRNCISIGGDSDTIAAIAGGIAEAFYGVPEEYMQQIDKYLPPCLMLTCMAFRSWINSRSMDNK